MRFRHEPTNDGRQWESGILACRGSSGCDGLRRRHQARLGLCEASSRAVTFWKGHRTVPRGAGGRCRISFFRFRQRRRQQGCRGMSTEAVFVTVMSLMGAVGFSRPKRRPLQTILQRRSASDILAKRVLVQSRAPAAWQAISVHFLQRHPLSGSLSRCHRTSPTSPTAPIAYLRSILRLAG